MPNRWGVLKKTSKSSADLAFLQQSCSVGITLIKLIITTRDGKYFLGLVWSLNVSSSILLRMHLIQDAPPVIIWLVEKLHFSGLPSRHLLPEGLDDTTLKALLTAGSCLTVRLSRCYSWTLIAMVENFSPFSSAQCEPIHEKASGQTMAEMWTRSSWAVMLVPFIILQFLLGGGDPCPQLRRKMLLFV